MNPLYYLRANTQDYGHAEKVVKVSMNKWQENIEVLFNYLVDTKKQYRNPYHRVLERMHHPGSAATSQAINVAILIKIR